MSTWARAAARPARCSTSSAALRCERLYLVGDIVDGWRLKRTWFWPQNHNDVLQKLLRLARKGVKVTYIPGNHDAFARSFCGARFGAVAVAREAVHKTADGRRYLGGPRRRLRRPDRARRRARSLADFGYRALVRLNAAAAAVRAPPWPPLLEPGRVREVPGQGRRGLHRPLRGPWPPRPASAATTASSAATSTRPHPPHRRRRLHQRRRLGGSCTAAVEHADGRMEVLAFGGGRCRRPHGVSG